MITLNLTNKDTSDIKFEVSKMPDGQQNIVIDNKTCFELVGAAKNWSGRPIVTIKSRLNNWLDLELIICTVASLRELDVQNIHLYVPYFLGARSDRKFEEGGNNYLKQVICPIINSLNFKSVTVLDPHSHVLEACLNNFKKIDNKELVNFAIHDLCWKQKTVKLNTPLDSILDNIILISPDAGASHKIYKLAEQIGYKGDIITCSKERDTDGKLSKVNVPISAVYSDSLKDHIIIDDICDGGATFINIAKELKKGFASMNDEDMKGKIYLIVTHGIFSAGFLELSKYFDGIYYTNSYKDIDLSEATSIKNNNILLKKLNVF
jgi:ribose-phosphate pyrophosphokinase